MCRPFLPFRWPVAGRHSFMARTCGDDMTQTNLLRGISSAGVFCQPDRARSSCICPAKGGVHIVHSFVHGRLSTCIVIPPPGPAFTTLWGVCDCGVQSVDRVQVCGIRNFFRGVLVWLIRETCPRLDTRLSFARMHAVSAVPAMRGVSRRLAVDEAAADFSDTGPSPTVVRPNPASSSAAPVTWTMYLAAGGHRVCRSVSGDRNCTRTAGPGHEGDGGETPATSSLARLAP
jgi:hypothetical protein